MQQEKEECRKCETKDNVKRIQLKYDCDHFCYTCDECIEDNVKGTCKSRPGEQELRKKDPSWKRDLVDSKHNDKDSPFRRVICYHECAKGNNEEWKLHVEGYEPRLVRAVCSMHKM